MLICLFLGLRLAASPTRADPFLPIHQQQFRTSLADPKVLVDLLGVRVIKPSSVLVEQLNLPRDRGLLIEYVRPNSAAEKGGLKRHDILLEVDGKPISSNVSDFPSILASFKPNTPVPAMVVRKGKQQVLKELTRPPDP